MTSLIKSAARARHRAPTLATRTRQLVGRAARVVASNWGGVRPALLGAMIGIAVDAVLIWLLWDALTR